jgi:hypothetical protein
VKKSKTVRKSERNAALTTQRAADHCQVSIVLEELAQTLDQLLASAVPRA